MSHFTEIRSDLFLYRDACNVYALRRGARALLIDGGSGDVLDHLPEIGVTGVDWAAPATPDRRGLDDVDLPGRRRHRARRTDTVSAVCLD
jgi:hypothetical protein